MAPRASDAARPRAPRPEPVEEGPSRYPAAKYAACEVAEKTPHGYRVKRVYDEDEEAALGPEWFDSPYDVGQVAPAPAKKGKGKKDAPAADEPPADE